MPIMFTLCEYSYRTGSGHFVGNSDCVENLPWELCDALNTYAVQSGSMTLAEFEGCDYRTVRAWLEDMFGYDGRYGWKAWADKCCWCDSELHNGRCDCEDFSSSVEQAEWLDREEAAYRIKWAGRND